MSQSAASVPAVPNGRFGAHPVLADVVFSRSIVASAVLVVAGAAVTAVAAQLAIPLWPVPITGQTLAVLLVGSTLGALRGALSMVLYAVLGLAGLPVFAPQDDGSHLTGSAALAAPSFGYIIGFIFAAAFVGWIAERSWDHRFLGAIASFLGGTVVTFALGMVWLASVLGLTLEQTLQAGLYPFVIGGFLKALLAASLIPLAWRAQKRLAGRRHSGSLD